MALALTVLGTGHRGRQWIGRALAEGHEIVAFADPAADARSQAAQAVPTAASCEDVDDALAAPRADAVIVASPPTTHADLARRALAHGLAVLVEKPLATSLADARALVEAAEHAQRPALVVQNTRYLRMTTATEAILRSGRLGTLRFAHTDVYRSPVALPAGLHNLEHNVLWNQGVHHLDQMIHLFGPVGDVCADCFVASGGASERGSSVHALLRFASGLHGTLTVTYESSGHEFFENGQRHFQRITGSDGTLHVLQRWLVLCPAGGWPRPVRRGRRTVHDDVVVLRQLEQAVRTGRPQPLDASGNLHTIAALEACVRSSAERAWVAVDA